MSKRPTELLLATHNQRKLMEIGAMLAPLGIEVKGADAFDLPEPDETGVTFAENAALKAQAAASATGLPALADDSGFCAEALYGGPGIYSARFADAHGGWDGGMAAVLEAAKEGASRKAWFVCDLCFIDPIRGEKHFFEGIVKGSLAQSPRGAHGFGYDPIFIPDGESRTFGEMLPDEKNARSHRYLALDKFLNHIKAQ